MQRQKCSIVNCEKFVDKRNGVCEMHYTRFRRNGDYYQTKAKNRPIEFKVDDNGCFIVTSHTPLGTGYFLTRKRCIRKSIHRLIYEECFGEIPDALVVRHKCDVTVCINPEHLELGTQRDNVMDTVKRNRTLRGENHPQHKLDETTVRKIKGMLSSGKRNCEIARMFNLHTSTVCNIKHGNAWKYVN